MKTSIEIQADILKTVWSTDYEGVQEIRTSIYQVISALTIASFALSSFLLKGLHQGQTPLSIATDVAIIGFIWGVFVVLKRDLRNRRKCLRFRQRLIENLGRDEAAEFLIFGDASGETIDIKDDDLIWIPVASTIAIFVKAVLLTVILEQHWFIVPTAASP